MTRIRICTLLVLLTAASTVAQEKSADRLEPQFADIVVAQSLMNQEVVDSNGDRIGTVDDIVLDLATARVAFFTTSRYESAAGRDDQQYPRREFLLIPSLIPEWENDKPLRISVPMNDLWRCSEDLQSCSAASVSDSDLAQLYKFYKAAPSSSTAKDDATPPMLTTVDVLDGRVVRDAARVKFGRIEEILLSPSDNWKIAFLALSQFNGHKDENERLAVPLAAFVQLPAKTTFLLDIPEEARLLEQTFKVGDWPHKIERGWVEFTHVKYGAAATDGIQTVERTAEN